MSVTKGKGWYVGDFNGDGKDDLLRHFTSSKGAEVALSTGEKFEAPHKMDGSQINWRPMVRWQFRRRRENRYF